MGNPPQSFWDFTPFRRNGQPKIAGMIGAKLRETIKGAALAHAKAII